MLDLDFCRQILGLKAPWKVLNVKIDQPAKQLDIYIGFAGVVKRSMFGFALKKAGLGGGEKQTCPHCHSALPKNGQFDTQRVRHLSTAGFTTFLHVPVPDAVSSSRTDCICMQPWVAPGTQCTVPMRDFVVSLLKSGTSAQAVLQLSGVSREELQEIHKTAKPAAVAGPGKKGTPSPDHAADGTTIPSLSDPVWQRLICGDLTLKSNTVALNMLLQRVRLNYRKFPEPETITAGATALKQFFVRNQRMLNLEIDQFKEIQTGESQLPEAGIDLVAVSSESDNIPNEDDPVWQMLISGDLSFKSNTVALNMLLQRVHMNYIKTPGEQSRMAGARQLQQFFIRHRKLLSEEIEQLGSRSPGTSMEAAEKKFTVVEDSLPGESAMVWQRIVSGDHLFETTMVGLQMILERTRKSLRQDPSDLNRQACIRILRDFFVKHKSRLGLEIAQLE